MGILWEVLVIRVKGSSNGPAGAFVLILVLLLPGFHPVEGADLGSVLEEVPEVWLGTLGPLREGRNMWTDFTCESVRPVDEPEPGIVQGRATAERVEIDVESLDPSAKEARLSRAVFVSPVLVFTGLPGAESGAKDTCEKTGDGVSFLDLLAWPGLEAEWFDVTDGRARVRQRGEGPGAFDIELTGIRLQGRNLDFTPSPGDRQMTFVGSGHVEGASPGQISFQWFGTPGEGVVDSRFGVGLDELDLSLLQPFLAEDIDFRIEGGKVSLLVNGTCREGRFLHTDNHLILEEIRIGAPESGSLEGMTIATVAGMLGGTLSVEFPVEGDLLDPNFDLLEAYGDAALVAAVNQAADRLLERIPAENRRELKEKLLDWVAPDLPEKQKNAILNSSE